MKKENNTKTTNDFELAQIAQDEKTERGKNLITDIAMVCGNDYTVIDSLAALLEIFTVKDSNIMIGDIAEDLQHYLFIWTKEHAEGFSQWKESVISGEKYKTSQ